MKKTSEQKNIEVKKGGGTLVGVVMSTKMKDTVVVAVSNFIKHPKYKKYFTRTTRLKAHDEGNTAVVGDKVTLIPVRPMSKTKHYKIASTASLASTASKT